MAAAPDPDEVLCSTAGKANFHRVTRLLIAGGTTLLREIFDNLCPLSNLPTVLSNPATQKQLKAAKLTKPQWDCLYPSPGVYGKSTDFDVTLLFRLLRAICGLTPPATGWDVLPPNSDYSLTAELARIKYYRNSVYGHVNQSMEITDDEFPSLWQEISGALVRIAGQISATRKHEWQSAVGKFLKDPLTLEDERNAQELDLWYSDDMEVKKSIERLHSASKDVREATEEVREGIERLEIGLEEKTDQLKDQLGEVHQSLERLSSMTASTQSAAGKNLNKQVLGSKLISYEVYKNVGLKS